MSTRCSILYDYGIHLYLESNSGEVCLSLPWKLTAEDAESWGSRINGQYGDLVVPLDKLKEWAQELNEFLKAQPK